MPEKGVNFSGKCLFRSGKFQVALTLPGKCPQKLTSSPDDGMEGMASQRCSL